VLHDGIPHDPIQGQGLKGKVKEVQKLRKWPISKTISSANIIIIIIIIIYWK